MNSKACKTPSLQTSPLLLLLGLLAALIISIIILSCVPPVSWDALTHHLAVPKLYLKHGGMYEIPSISFSYYPMNLEFLYIIPLFFGNDIIPKFIHFSFALMTAWLIFCYLKKRLDTLFALLGALFFLSIPIIVKLSITVYVDLGLIFFSTASLLYLLKWSENYFKPKYLIISAVCCGLALGTKYNGLIVLLLLAMFVPFIYSRLSRNTTKTSVKALWFGTVFLFVALLVFSPWMIRNYIWTNNPVSPLYNSLFNPPVKEKSTTDSIKENASAKKSLGKMGPFVYRKVIYKEKWWEIALTPLRIFFQGEDDNPQYFDGKLNFFLLILPFLAFGRTRADSRALTTEKIVLLSYSTLFILLVFFYKDMRIRWI
jgi:4-amino-4-deoxy-L-arabinose transferase-like glycosyltransferase